MAETTAQLNGKFATIDQVAKLLQVSGRTVRRLVSSGQLQAYRINDRLVRISTKSVAQLLRECQIMPGVDTGGEPLKSRGSRTS